MLLIYFIIFMRLKQSSDVWQTPQPRCQPQHRRHANPTYANHKPLTQYYVSQPATRAFAGVGKGDARWGL